MHEFRFSKRNLVFIISIFSIFIFPSLFFILEPLFNNFQDIIDFDTYKYLAPFLFLVVLFFILAIYDYIKYKIIIDHEKIALQSFFSNRSIFFHEIKGFRFTEKGYLIIEPKNEFNKKRIASQLFNNKELINWLEINNYQNTDNLKLEEENEAFLKNDLFGANENERKQNLRKAKNVAQVINIIGGIISIWIFFYPNPYKLALGCGIIFLIISLLVYKIFNGLIKIGEARKSPYPTIFISLLFGVLVLLLRQLIDFKLIDYVLPINYSILISLVFLGIIFFKNEEFSFSSLKNLSSIIGVSIMTFLFCYSSIILINCSFDVSNPQIFYPKVLKNNISKGKHTSYYLTLSPWGPIKKEEEESVSKYLYEQININDTVEVNLMNGKYDIPWYEIFVK